MFTRGRRRRGRVDDREMIVLAALKAYINMDQCLLPNMQWHQLSFSIVLVSKVLSPLISEASRVTGPRMTSHSGA
jgi:hypothetical protein